VVGGRAGAVELGGERGCDAEVAQREDKPAGSPTSGRRTVSYRTPETTHAFVDTR
jgi:hypothetical protein